LIKGPETELKTLAKRTAYKIVERRVMEIEQRKVDFQRLKGWQEGEETFVLPVLTGDVINDGAKKGKDTKNSKETKESLEKVVFNKFSETKGNIKLGGGLLRSGEVVAFPTETVYGLGANALSTSAVQKIYTAKNRPADNPLIVHFGSISHLQTFFSNTIPTSYLPLIETFWPGPLTILLPNTPELGISPLVTAGLDTVAVRVPSSSLARGLILEAGVPIAAPSANASTRPSPTMAGHVFADLNGRIPVILSADEDAGGHCEVGLESTVVDGLSEPPAILRLGGVSLESIRALGGIWRDTVIYQKPLKNKDGVVNGEEEGLEEEFKPRTPGMKYRHYSPRCPVYLYPANSPQPTTPSRHLPPSDSTDRKVAVLCTRNWEPIVDENSEVEFNWMGDDDEEVARNLFKCVRDMDEWGAECIVVEGVEDKGIGRSVMERLRKMSGGVMQESETNIVDTESQSDRR
jgi:L-threonylcarbamoyladenylate synthase